MMWKLPYSILLLAALILAGALSPAAAEEDAWRPPEPEPGADDWIRLTSGEWLRGEINLFRDEFLLFDSEELDELEIDWDDVAEIRSPRILTYVFEGDIVYTGSAAMQDSVIRILEGEETREGPRNGLLSVIEGSPSELNYWGVKASLGLTARRGNTDQSDVNSLVLIRREATRSRLDLTYTGNFSDVEHFTLGHSFNDVKQNNVAQLTQCAKLCKNTTDLTTTDQRNLSSCHCVSPPNQINE